MSAGTVRVYLADDDAELLRVYRRMLDAAEGIEVVGLARESVSAAREIEALAPDVAILDVRMPPGGGSEVLRSIDPARTRALMLSTFDLDELIASALRLGAAGYLLKNASPEEIIAAIRAVAAGHASLAPEITARLLTRLTGAAQPAGDPFAAAPLTPRELQVTRLVAAGHGNQSIAAALGLSAETVKTYLKRIFARYGFADRTQLAVAAHRAGLLHERR